MITSSGNSTLALISSPRSLSPGLEYSAGEGTNYPPKFDSAPGKPVFTPLLIFFFLHSLFCLKFFVQREITELFLFHSQVPGGLPQRSGALRTGMKMWVFYFYLNHIISLTKTVHCPRRSYSSVLMMVIAAPWCSGLHICSYLARRNLRQPTKSNLWSCCGDLLRIREQLKVD